MALHVTLFEVALRVSGPVAVGRHLGDQTREELLQEIATLPEHGILLCDFHDISVVDYDWARAAIVPAYDAVVESEQPKYLVLRVYHAAIRESLLTGVRWDGEHIVQQIKRAEGTDADPAQIESLERDLAARYAHEVAVVQIVFPTEQDDWHYISRLPAADVHLLERIRQRGNVRAIELIDDAGAEGEEIKDSLVRLAALRLVYIMEGAEASGDVRVLAFDRLLSVS